MRKIVRDGLKDGEKFPIKSKFEEIVKTRWSKMNLDERMSFVEKAKKDKERYEKAMEQYEVKRQAKRNKVLQAKRYVLNLHKEIKSTKLRKPKESMSALQHYCKKVRKNAEDGKKAWDALSSKERKVYTAIAKKDSKRFSTVCFFTLSLSLLQSSNNNNDNNRKMPNTRDERNTWICPLRTVSRCDWRRNRKISRQRS
jgi:hypothetical protein